MIGDRLDTDIEFGVKGGIETLCVLTGTFMIATAYGSTIHPFILGVTSEVEVLSSSSEVRPDYYMDSFAGFAPQ